MDSTKNSTDLLKRALSLLARREHAASELKSKLARYSDDEQAVQAVIERCVEEGWQDDARYARMRLNARASSGWGPYVIVQELKHRGIPDEVVNAVLAESETDWYDVAIRYAQRRRLHAGTPEERWKSTGKLMQRGFPQEIAGSVV
ncbi:MAG: regulatory protein RecX, partial [Gammaproteobacteria bacterium]